MAEKRRKGIQTSWIDISAIVVFFAGFAIAIVAVFRLFGHPLVFERITLSHEDAADFGSFIGGVVGSLWALTGVLLFFRSLLIQREDLRLQSQVLAEQRTELANQSLQLSLQTEIYETQRFESTFYFLIRNLKEELTWLRNDTKPGTDKKYIVGQYECLVAGCRLVCEGDAFIRDKFKDAPSDENSLLEFRVRELKNRTGLRLGNDKLEYFQHPDRHSEFLKILVGRMFTKNYYGYNRFITPAKIATEYVAENIRAREMWFIRKGLDPGPAGREFETYVSVLMALLLPLELVLVLYFGFYDSNSLQAFRRLGVFARANRIDEAFAVFPSDLHIQLLKDISNTSTT